MQGAATELTTGLKASDFPPMNYVPDLCREEGSSLPREPSASSSLRVTLGGHLLTLGSSHSTAHLQPFLTGRNLVDLKNNFLSVRQRFSIFKVSVKILEASNRST